MFKTWRLEIMLNRLENPAFTRRGALMLAAGAGFAGFSRLYAASPDFWNKKDPADWSRDEIEQLTSKSPWAKEVSVDMPVQRGEYGDPNGGQTGQTGGQPGGQPGQQGGVWGGGPRIGGMPGMGIPGMGGGGGGMGGGRRDGRQPVQNFRGTIRWESAKPIGEALKNPLPEGFADRYVISVSGIPLNPNSRRGYQDDSENDSRSASTQDALDRLKSLTSLEPKGKRDAQPGIVQQQASSGLGSILFGFSKEILSLKPEDKEVTFSTQFGRIVIRTKFNLKEMIYRGDLAV
jgi:hypothetical protein